MELLTTFKVGDSITLYDSFEISNESYSKIAKTIFEDCDPILDEEIHNYLIRIDDNMFIICRLYKTALSLDSKTTCIITSVKDQSMLCIRLVHGSLGVLTIDTCETRNELYVQGIIKITDVELATLLLEDI